MNFKQKNQNKKVESESSNNFKENSEPNPRVGKNF